MKSVKNGKVRTEIMFYFFKIAFGYYSYKFFYNAYYYDRVQNFYFLFWHLKSMQAMHLIQDESEGK